MVASDVGSVFLRLVPILFIWCTISFIETMFHWSVSVFFVKHFEFKLLEASLEVNKTLLDLEWLHLVGKSIKPVLRLPRNLNRLVNRRQLQFVSIFLVVEDLHVAIMDRCQVLDLRSSKWIIKRAYRGLEILRVWLYWSSGPGWVNRCEIAFLGNVMKVLHLWIDRINTIFGYACDALPNLVESLRFVGFLHLLWGLFEPLVHRIFSCFLLFIHGIVLKLKPQKFI